jgi:hypothetical protein
LHPLWSEDNVPGSKSEGEMKLSLIVQGRHPAGEDMRARLEDDLELVRRAAEEIGARTDRRVEHRGDALAAILVTCSRTIVRLIRRTKG